MLQFITKSSLPLLAVCCLLLCSNCATKKLPALSECSCIGSGNGGSIRITAYGFGKTNNLAVENAKKNAIQEVIFKGIKAGNAGCPSRPIVEDINKRQTTYFTDFFRENGNYLQFINLTGDQIPTRVKVQKMIKVSIDAVVDHKRLVQQMTQDKQIRSINDGF